MAGENYTGSYAQLAHLISPLCLCLKKKVTILVVGKKNVQINMVSKEEPFPLFAGIGDEEIPDTEGCLDKMQQIDLPQTLQEKKISSTSLKCNFLSILLQY